MANQRALRRETCADAQEWRCWHCSGPMTREQGRSDSCTLEHLDPRCRPAPPAGRRTVAACFRCNQATRPVSEPAPFQLSGKVTLADVWPRS